MPDTPVGCLVRHEKFLWLVTEAGRLLTLGRLSGESLVECQVEARTMAEAQAYDPTRRWGYLPLQGPPELGFGGARKVQLGRRRLEPLMEWTPCGPPSWQVPCRGLYLNPSLKLGIGDTLRVEYASGDALMGKVNGKFGSLSKRIAATQPKEAPLTRWDMFDLLDEKAGDL